MESRLRAAALRGLSARKVREEKGAIKTIINNRKCTKSPTRPICEGWYRKDDIRRIKKRTKKGKTFASKVRRRNRHHLSKKPFRKPILSNRTRNQPLTEKPTTDVKKRTQRVTIVEEEKPRQLLEREWRLLNEYNQFKYEQEKKSRRYDAIQRQNDLARTLQHQIDEQHQVLLAQQRDRIQRDRIILKDVESHASESLAKKKAHREKMRRMKSTRERQFKEKRIALIKEAKGRRREERRETEEVKRQLLEEAKARARRKKENLQEQIRIIQENKRARRKKQQEAAKALKIEEKLAKEYQRKMEKEQRAREERLKEIYRVKEKKLNLALYVRASIDEKLKADEERARLVRERHRQKELKDAARREREVLRRKIELRDGLASQIRDIHQRRVEQVREERLEARRIAKDFREGKQEAREKQKLRAARNAAYRRELLVQCQQQATKKLQTRMRHCDYLVHRAALEEAAQWKSGALPGVSRKY